MHIFTQYLHHKDTTDLNNLKDIENQNLWYDS